MSIKGNNAYPGLIMTTCTSHLGTMKCVTIRPSYLTTFVLVIHSLTECNSEGHPTHTANREDGTIGKDHMKKMPLEHREENGQGGGTTMGG